MVIKAIANEAQILNNRISGASVVKLYDFVAQNGDVMTKWSLKVNIKHWSTLKSNEVTRTLSYEAIAQATSSIWNEEERM